MQKLICCEIFRELIETMTLPDDLEVDFVRKELHLQPRLLHCEIEQILNDSKSYELIILGFGLCGNALDQLQVPYCPVVIPRVHDCVPLLCGSKSKYESIHKKNPFTFYYACGYSMVKDDFERCLAKYGKKTTLNVYKTMFHNYSRFLYIHSDQPHDMQALSEAREISSFLDLPCDEMTGSPAYLEKLLYGPWDEEQFLKIGPPGKIRMEYFF